MVSADRGSQGKSENFKKSGKIREYKKYHGAKVNKDACFWCDCKRLKTDTDISYEQISRVKRFILSWKVRENEFCRVVETMV